MKNSLMGLLEELRLIYDTFYDLWFKFFKREIVTYRYLI